MRRWLNGMLSLQWHDDVYPCPYPCLFLSFSSSEDVAASDGEGSGSYGSFQVWWNVVMVCYDGVMKKESWRTQPFYFLKAMIEESPS